MWGNFVPPGGLQVVPLSMLDFHDGLGRNESCPLPILQGIDGRGRNESCPLPILHPYLSLIPFFLPLLCSLFILAGGHTHGPPKHGFRRLRHGVNRCDKRNRGCRLHGAETACLEWNELQRKCALCSPHVVTNVAAAHTHAYLFAGLALTPTGFLLWLDIMCVNFHPCCSWSQAHPDAPHLCHVQPRWHAHC